MSIAALQSVTSRVGEIQSRIDQLAPSRSTFAETLRAAEATPVASSEGVPSGHFVVTPQGSQSTRRTQSTHATESFSIFGIMGTPIMLRPGAGLTPQFSGSVDDWSGNLPAAAQQWAPSIDRAAQEAGIDPRLLAAMVWQESGFQPDAVSHSGAIGLTQLMPATAAGLDVDPVNPIENLRGGARYLAWTIREFGSLELGLAAYNAGPGSVRAAGGIPDIPETRAYVPRVIDYYRQLGGIA